MDKVKLAICMKDLEYQARFVNCLMNHYKHLYEVHVFTNLEELKMKMPLAYSAIITGEYSTEELTNFVEGGEKLLYLTEEIIEKNEPVLESIIYVEKYQEVYKIAEVIQRITGDESAVQGKEIGETICKWTGIYSLSKETYQIPTAVLLAEIYGEKERVLLLDLQAHSGLMDEEADLVHMGLEDLLSVATTGNYSKSRLLESIRHESNWDYVYPVKNTECLVEGSRELYEALLEILKKEFQYQRIIINFGTIFSGQSEMMERCDIILLLSGKEDTWREDSFIHELQRREKKQLLQKIHKIDLNVPLVANGTWRSLLEKWRWSDFTQNIRQLVKKENLDGEVM